MRRKKSASDFNQQDRAYGAGLPSSVSAATFTRLSRVAHPVWELRRDDAPESEGYQLVRKLEETAVDMRKSASVQPVVAPRLSVGQHVAWIRRGEVAPAVVININHAAETADVEFEDNGVLDVGVPLEALLLDLAPATAAPVDPFSPEIMPTSHCAQLGNGGNDSNDDQVEDWQKSRPLVKVLEEVEFLLRTRGKHPDLVQVRDALKRMIADGAI